MQLESLISAGMAATAMIAGQTLISGSAYALFRSLPQEAQAAISSELVMAKLTRAAINTADQQAALLDRSRGRTDVGIRLRGTGAFSRMIGCCFSGALLERPQKTPNWSHELLGSPFRPPELMYTVGSRTP